MGGIGVSISSDIFCFKWRWREVEIGGNIAASDL